MRRDGHRDSRWRVFRLAMSLRNLPEPVQAERFRDHPLTIDFQKLLEWTTVVFSEEVFRAFGRRELHFRPEVQGCRGGWPIGPRGPTGRGAEPVRRSKPVIAEWEARRMPSCRRTKATERSSMAATEMAVSSITTRTSCTI